MLIEKDNSCLLLIDVQEKLTPLVLDKERLVKNCHWLLSLANDLNIQIFTTEQYPKGLGATLALLKPLLANTQINEKVEFSIMGNKKCAEAFKSIEKKQVVVMGIETSVCILQSVMELLKQSYQVFVVVDAVSGRHALDGKIALERMQQAGAFLVTKEMVFFEWLRTAGANNFKKLSQTYLQG